MEFLGTKGDFILDRNEYNCYLHRKEDFEDGRRISIDIRLYDTSQKPLTDISNTNECYYNALLISKSKEMFQMLNSVLQLQKEKYGNGSGLHLAMIVKAKEIETLLKEATTLPNG